MLVHYIPKIIFFLKKALSGAPPPLPIYLVTVGGPHALGTPRAACSSPWSGGACTSWTGGASTTGALLFC